MVAVTTVTRTVVYDSIGKKFIDQIAEMEGVGWAVRQIVVHPRSVHNAGYGQYKSLTSDIIVVYERTL